MAERIKASEYERRVKRRLKAMRDVVEEAAWESAKTAQKELRAITNATPFKRGMGGRVKYRRAWVARRWRGHGARIGNTAPHALLVEYGSAKFPARLIFTSYLPRLKQLLHINLRKRLRKV